MKMNKSSVKTAPTHRSFCVVFVSVPSTLSLSRYLYQLVVLNYTHKNIRSF
uniref:Uncharacterized protein n=1 Tax=Helianthus annuus TaxID=4232 RepID=A0A251S3X7_HELAN